MCKNRGKRVERVTVQSLLRRELAAKIPEAQHYYCRTPACSVVYFSTAANPLFHKGNITVRVGIKETADPIRICYCFGHTEGSIREEIMATGRSSAEDNIRAEIAAGNCDCERRNPAGQCCLGGVRATVQRLLLEGAVNAETANKT